MRPVKSRHKAIERLAPLVDGINPEPVGHGQYVIHVARADFAPAKKNSAHTLALLAEEARHSGLEWEDVYKAVRWVGNIPLEGLSAWKEHALEWLKTGGTT